MIPEYAKSTNQIEAFKTPFTNIYEPVAYMKRRYPKASKKKRVLKKWINRFGPDFCFNPILAGKNPFLELIDEDPWKLRTLGKAPHILDYGMEGLEGLRVGNASLEMEQES